MLAHMNETDQKSEKRFNWHEYPVLRQPLFSRQSMTDHQQPFLIAMHDVDYNRPDNVHWHEAIEIGCVIAGEGFSVVEGQEYSFSQGYIHVRNSNIEHMDYAFEHCKIFNIHFHPDLIHDTLFHNIDDISNQLFRPQAQQLRPLVYPNESHAPYITHLLMLIHDENTTQAYGWMMTVKGLILQIVSILARHYRMSQNETHHQWKRREMLSRLTPALEIIEANLSNPASLGDLAKSVSMSPTYFSTIFKEVIGNSPVAYRNALRIRNARYLLINTDLSVGQISDQCGFETVRQFNRLFIKLIGMTPTAYREYSG